jgi:pimeloyl-ACP methyl ester carboxylesterase
VVGPFFMHYRATGSAEAGSQGRAAAFPPFGLARTPLVAATCDGPLALLSGLVRNRALAALYLALFDRLDLNDVTVVGNSIGGWIAAEMAVLGSPRISGLVLVDAVGIEVPGHPVADSFSLTVDQVFQLSFHNRFSILTTGARTRPPSRRPASSSSPTPVTCPRSRPPTNYSGRYLATTRSSSPPERHLVQARPI